jgi:glycosyltransferase involved in cell wall biosynthesis
MTIAIPVHERTAYFDMALASALAQTVACPVIVYDNASSTDHFERRCAQYGERVAYLRQPSNVGMFGNWNACVAAAPTEFVCILGDDDILHPQFAAEFHRALDEHPRLDIFFSDFFYLRQSDRQVVRNDFAMRFGVHSGREVLELAALRGLGFPTIAAVLRKSAMQPYYQALTSSNDWLELCSAPLDRTVVGTARPLMGYRKHESSDSVNHAMRNSLAHVAIYALIARRLRASGSSVAAARARARAENLWTRLYVRCTSDQRREIFQYYAADADSPYLRILSEEQLGTDARPSAMQLVGYLSSVILNRCTVTGRREEIVPPSDRAWVGGIDPSF